MHWRTPPFILKLGGYAISVMVGGVVREAKLRCRMLGRFEGQIPQTPPFSILLGRSAKSDGGFGGQLNWRNVLNIMAVATKMADSWIIP